MQSSPDERAVGLIADYCGFLREAAFVLTMLSESPPAERRDMFDTLVGVESESSATYVVLSHALADSSAPQTRWHGEAGHLTESLHACFEALVNSGATLLDVTATENAPDIRRQCDRIQDATQTLGRSWHESQEPLRTERLLRSIEGDVSALNRSLESGGVGTLDRDQGRPNVARTPTPSR